MQRSIKLETSQKMLTDVTYFNENMKENTKKGQRGSRRGRHWRRRASMS